MSDEALTILLATLIGLVPNLIIKWIEKQKPKEELDKTSIESADMSLEMLKLANETLLEHIKFQEERHRIAREELVYLQQKYLTLVEECERKLKEKDKKENEDAIRS